MVRAEGETDMGESPELVLKVSNSRGLESFSRSQIPAMAQARAARKAKKQSGCGMAGAEIEAAKMAANDDHVDGSRNRLTRSASDQAGWDFSQVIGDVASVVARIDAREA